MEEKPQFKFYIEPQLLDRLDRLAATCGFATAQQFVIAGLDAYAELLAQLLRERQDQDQLLINRQKEQLLSKGDQGKDSVTSRRK